MSMTYYVTGGIRSGYEKDPLTGTMVAIIAARVDLGKFPARGTAETHLRTVRGYAEVRIEERDE